MILNHLTEGTINERPHHQGLFPVARAVIV